MSPLITPLSKAVKEIGTLGLLRNAHPNGPHLTPSKHNSERMSCILEGRYIEKLSTT